MPRAFIDTGGRPKTAPLSEAAAGASQNQIRPGISGLPSQTLIREAARPERLDPEFVDVPGMHSLFGIKRSLAYALLAEGLIQGVSLRRRNQVRGKRLFKVDSVRAYLRSQMEAAK